VDPVRAGWREDGLGRTEVEVRLPVRQVRLRLTVLDAASGAPLTRCRFAATREGDERPRRSFSKRSETGFYETWIEAGTHSFLVEAPDHEPLRAEVEVPAGDGFDWTARLVGEREESVEVSLTVTVLSATTGAPVERAKIEVVEPRSGKPAARLEAERSGGTYLLPAPSGEWRLRVTAEGYEGHEEDLLLDPAKREAQREVRLQPR